MFKGWSNTGDSTSISQAQEIRKMMKSFDPLVVNKISNKRWLDRAELLWPSKGDPLLKSRIKHFHVTGALNATGSKV